MDLASPDWRNRLRGDPAPWLLDYADNSSIYFWFQRDIVGRPEDAPALAAAREKILYSAPVQEILAAQDASGFWDNPVSLIEPRYRATLWSLALLAELGVPRNSRRARAACEFVLQNAGSAAGDFTGLLLHTLLYFNYRADPRLARPLQALAANLPNASPGAAVYAVWALAGIPSAQRSPDVLKAIEQGAEMILDALALGAYPTLGAFPPFDPGDALLALRVLTQIHRANDPRASAVIEKIWARQGEGARWSLETSYDGMLATRVEAAGIPSKWATLNVLRVLTQK